MQLTHLVCLVTVAATFMDVVYQAVCHLQGLAIVAVLLYLGVYLSHLLFLCSQGGDSFLVLLLVLLRPLLQLRHLLSVQRMASVLVDILTLLKAKAIASEQADTPLLPKAEATALVQSIERYHCLKGSSLSPLACL